MAFHPEARHHSWLVHRITAESLNRELRCLARGVLVDVGCGVKPYARLTEALVTRHIAVDYAGTKHDLRKIDIFAPLLRYDPARGLGGYGSVHVCA